MGEERVILFFIAFLIFGPKIAPICYVGFFSDLLTDIKDAIKRTRPLVSIPPTSNPPPLRIFLIGAKNTDRGQFEFFLGLIVLSTYLST